VPRVVNIMDLGPAITSLRSSLFNETDAKKGGGSGKPIGSTSTHKDGSTYKKTKQGWKYLGKGQSGSGDAPKSGSKQAPPGFGGGARQLKKPKEGQPPKPGELAPLNPNIPWKEVKHEPQSSEEKHMRGGSYTPERKALHKEIFKAFMGHVPSVSTGKIPVAVMLMGGPATGKGSLTKTVPDKTFVKVDADRIKEMLPDYQEMVANGDKNAASYVHKESGMLASRMRDYAKKNRQNMVLDGTGRYAGSYHHRMGELQDAGYHVQLMMPYVDDVEKVVRRANQRGAETGRHVPESFIRQNHDQISDNFMGLSKVANSAFLFDNSGDKMRMVYTAWDGGESGVDDEFMKTFREKHARRVGRGMQQSAVERVAADFRACVHEGESDLAVDPRDLAKKALEIEPEPEKEKRFSPDQGIILPEPDDVAI